MGDGMTAQDAPHGSVPWKRREVIGLATLYLGDCREIVPTLPRPAAVISDPPYGQRLKTNIAYAGGTKVRAVAQRSGSACLVNPTVWPDEIAGDAEPFDPTPWLSLADVVLLWGAHRFADRLPVGAWLVWDKVPNGKQRDQGDGEAAWLNRNRPLRIYRGLWDGLCVASQFRDEVTAGQRRVHPTQKPVALMAWCLEQAQVPDGGLILDPYMGAGSTGIVAVRAGHPFVGCELEPLYFDTACRRIEEAQRQGDLLRDVPA